MNRGRVSTRVAALAAAVVLVMAGASQAVGQGGGLATFPTGKVTIESGGNSHEFRVEIAKTARQVQQGLMFRRTMAPDAGMLFVYRRPIDSAMWMKNTLIPLDMLFIREGGEIGRIAERTVPMSEAIIPSGGPVIAVLELNAGTASRLGIKPGDKVVSPALPPAGD